MAEPIKLFRTIKTVRQTLKIYPSQSDRDLQFGAINLFFMLSQLLVLTMEGFYLLFGATSIAEYGASFSIFNLTLLNVIFYSMNIVQMKNVVKLMGGFDDFIEMSKLKSSCQRGDSRKILEDGRSRYQHECFFKFCFFGYPKKERNRMRLRNSCTPI